MDRRRATNAILGPADMALGAAVGLARSRGWLDETSPLTSRLLAKLFRKPLQVGNRLAVEGEFNVPFEGGVILAANHQSVLDYAVLMAATPRELQVLGAPDLRETLVLRQVFQSAADRESDAARIALGKGQVVAMFPEGALAGAAGSPRHTVDPTTGLLPGRTDLVRLAIECNVPIVPVGISGSGKALPPEIYPRVDVLRLPALEPIEVTFGRPMVFSAYRDTELTDELLAGLTREMMEGISALVDHESNYVPVNVPAPSLPSVESLGVLLLHGFTSSVEAVDGLIPHLEAAGIPYERPILRGHGTRYEDMRGVTADDWYEDAESALLELSKRVEGVVVVGLSMGGLVSIDLASRHPDKIVGLVTAAAALKFKDPLAPLSGLLARAVPFWPSPASFHDPELAKTCTNYPKFATDAFLSLYEYSKKVEARLPEVRVPTLVLAARRDQIIAADAAIKIYEKIASPIREIRWFERTGHEMLQDMEAQDVFASIMEFVRRFRSEEQMRAAG